MSSITYRDRVEIESIYDGDLFIVPACQISEDLCKHAESIVADIFESPIDQIETDDATANTTIRMVPGGLLAKSAAVSLRHFVKIKCLTHL